MNTILSTLTSGLEAQMAVFRFRVQLPGPQTCLKSAGGAPKALTKINSNRSFFVSDVQANPIPSVNWDLLYFHKYRYTFTPLFFYGGIHSGGKVGASD